MGKPDVSVIIVTHNARDFLRETLESVFNQKGLLLQVIVVDNQSTDGTIEMVSRLFPKVKIVKRDTSTGFSAANNLGVSYAKSDLILFFNPDITFTSPQDVKKLVDKYKSLQGVGIVTPRVNLVRSGQIDATCHRGFPTPWASFTHFSGLEKVFPTSRLFTQYTAAYKGYETEHAVDAVGGMCMLMSREVGESVSWWDEDYPFYGEDLDLCYRVVQKGRYNYYYPGVVALHYKGVTTGMSKSSRHVTHASRDTTKQVKRWSVLAMETFYRKHYMAKYPKVVTALVFAGIKLLKIRRLVFT